MKINQHGTWHLGATIALQTIKTSHYEPIKHLLIII